MIHGSLEMYQYTHLIVEAKSKFSPNLKPYLNTHEIIDYIEAFHHVSFNYLTIPPVKVKTKPVLFLLKRKENYLELMPDLSTFTEEHSNEEEIDNRGSTDDIQMQRKSERENTHMQKINLQKLKQELHESYEISEESGIQLDRHPVKTDDSNNYIKEESKVNEEMTQRYDFSERNEASEITEIPRFKSKEIDEIQSGVHTKQKLSIKDSIRKIKQENVKMIKSSEAIKQKSVGSIEKGRVKENIRNIIKEFKNEQYIKSSEEKPRGTKEKIKEIIENEKKILEEEELRKLQHQIISIIQTNPNIVNKELIKEKIENIVFSDASEISSQSSVTRNKLQKPVERKKLIKKDIAKAAINTFDDDLSIDDRNNNHEGEYLEIEENELNLYKKVNVDDDSALEYDQNIDVYSPLEVEFQAANEHLENIMMMIEEIVSTMEIEESHSDED